MATSRREKDLRSLGLSASNATTMHRAMVEVERTGSPRAADAVLDDANRLLEGHGIEAINGKWHDHYYQDIVALYVNMGDTYNGTILYDAVKRKFYVTTWGDFVEAKSRAYEIA